MRGPRPSTSRAGTTAIPLSPLPQGLTTVKTWRLDDTSQLSGLRSGLAEALAGSDEESRDDREALT